MPLCHFSGYNIWLLKPTHLNRGQGIHVFRDLDTLKSLITKYCKKNGDNSKTEIDMENEFIIQKYIENPLLINGRKFEDRKSVV